MRNIYLAVLLLLLGSAPAWAQAQRRITGTVRAEENGEPLPGVTVLVKGTTIGAGTNGEGFYELQVPTSGTVTLRFTYVGYGAVEVPITNQTEVSPKLPADNKQLEDVVVIGYQAVQRRDLTGAVSSVSAQQIKDIPVNSAAEALTGRLAGVQLTTSEGSPGAAAVVRVRGGGSITQDNSPLYIVDGIQVENALATIAPQDIASVDVLKDASATAIYGARGANGVIIITTKIGKEGRTTVTYNGFAGFRRLARKLDLLSPYDFVRYQYARAQSAGATAQQAFRTAYGTSQYDSLQAFRNVPTLDWQEQVFGRDAFQQTHNVSIAGGGKATNYALSLTRNTEDGIQRGSSYDRYLVNLRMDNKLTEKLRLGFNARYNVTTLMGNGTSTTSTSQASRLRNVIEYRPFELAGGAVQDQGDFDEAQATSGARLGNPLTLIEQEYRQNRQRVINVNGTVSYAILKNLTARSTVGVETTSTTTDTFNGLVTPVARQNANRPTAGILTQQLTTLNNSNVLAYDLNKGKSRFDALVGHEVYQTTSNSLNVQALYLPSAITAERALASLNLASAPTGSTTAPITATTNRLENRILSGFGRVNYAYDDKYLATFTFRADGSSKFAPGRRVGYFPAGSLAWRISRESFMPQTDVLTDLKLRVSYGLAGNNRIGDGLFLAQYGTSVPNATGAGTGMTSSQYGFGEAIQAGVAPVALSNLFLRWETTTSRNLGVDLSLLNGRVQFTADAYYNSTYDLLLNQPIPSTSGYSTQQRNIGNTHNKGLEFQLSGTVVQTPDFTWTANANVSLNRNEVEYLGPGQTSFTYNSGWAGTDGPSSDYIIQVGQPLGQMYGYVYDGFYKADDFVSYTEGTTRPWKPKDGIAVNPTASIGEGPGDARYKDLNGDGIISDLDRTVIGNANPKLTGGFNQQFTYKWFDASLFFNFVLGNDVYNANAIEFSSGQYANTNLLASAYDDNVYKNTDPTTGQLVTDMAALNALNQNATEPMPSRGRYIFSSRYVESGSFLRFNNLTLGYTLPKALVQRAGISSLRFYATANNLAIITGYSGYDPEVSTRRGQPLSPGVDYAAYPRSRAYLFGLNLSF